MTNYSMEGRTYRYFKGPGAPLYPFGYGLSYAHFKYSDLVVNPTVVKSSNDLVRITVNCYNAGPYDSDEVRRDCFREATTDFICLFIYLFILGLLND